MAKLLAIGEHVRDGLGHWCQVLEITAGGFRVRVQPLTWVGTPATLAPIGAPVLVGRSDLRADGE